MILEIVVNATKPSWSAKRAAERVSRTVCRQRGLINPGPATFVRYETARIDGWRRNVLVYVVHAHHRDDADGSRNDRWSLGTTGMINGGRPT